MKAVVTIIVLILVGLGAFMYFSPEAPEEPVVDENTEEVTEEPTQTLAEEGSYTVLPEESVVNWAGKKPLIDGYINSGVLSVTSGAVEVAGASSTGSFEIDMNTLAVSETKAKPGEETTLEGHLKGENWFNVEEYPTASFEITNVTPSESDPLLYTVVGNLTMKGETGELTFPAKIYQNEEGQLVAEASFEFDRTKWGITAGSGSFFDNLADNVIDDMVALSFTLVAEKHGEMMEEGDVMMEEGAGMMVPGEEGEDMVVEEDAI